MDNGLILDSELKFKIKLLNDIGEKYMLIKSNHKYSVIDFICINKNNLRNFYIEHKYKKYDYCGYDTLYIGYDKVNKVNEYFYNTIYIWEFNKELYWIKHNKNFLTYEKVYVNGGDAYDILVSDCNSGYDSLLNYIGGLSNNRF